MKYNIYSVKCNNTREIIEFQVIDLLSDTRAVRLRWRRKSSRSLRGSPRSFPVSFRLLQFEFSVIDTVQEILFDKEGVLRLGVSFQLVLEVLVGFLEPLPVVAGFLDRVQLLFPGDLAEDAVEIASGHGCNGGGCGGDDAGQGLLIRRGRSCRRRRRRRRWPSWSRFRRFVLR